MRKSVILRFFVLPTVLFAVPAMAAARLGDSCDLSVLGVRDNTNFYRFDNSLREAITARDVMALASLVQYPVGLNYEDGGRLEAQDAATLRSYLADGHWPVLQDMVNKQQPGELFCNADGVMYDDGTVWANPDARSGAFRITSFNLPGRAPARRSPTAAAPAHPAGASNVLLACDTNKFHIVIDMDSDGQPRYRSWNQPNVPPAQPAMYLVGDESREGTGMCSHRTWRFRNGNTDYVLAEPGCNAGDVPANAKARLTVEINGRSELNSWCH